MERTYSNAIGLLLSLYAERDLVLLYLHESTEDGQLLTAVLHHSLRQNGDDGCVIGQDLKVTLCAGHLHALHLTGELYPLGRNYLERQHIVNLQFDNLRFTI